MLKLTIFKEINLKTILYNNKRLVCGLNLWNEDITSEIKLKIEKHWRDKLETRTYDENEPDTTKKYYVLSMFPYPSGFLHMGHVRVYTISDSIARFQRMNGKNVIHPIGWDAFGLPAENAAIDRQIAPQKWTTQNIDHMREQLKNLGCSFEWNRELATCNSDYYRWTQELFLKLYDAGLIYRQRAMVNWDPIDETVLADEQVDGDGRSWRSGAVVERRPLRQWFIKTTQFARALYEGLNEDTLQDWRDVIALQRHWIGECDGVSFQFNIASDEVESGDPIFLWTNMPERLTDVEFVVVRKGHILAASLDDHLSNKNGAIKLDVHLQSPLLGDKKIPVFVASEEEFDFLPNTDSFLGIPGACQKSTEFASQHSIPFRKSLRNFADLDELNAAREQICARARALNLGGFWTSAKLKDWLISRQRFWGTPIPIINCDKCGAQPVPRDQLPVELPTVQLGKKSSRKGGGSLLLECTEWVNVACPKCGGGARRETDTIDTFFDSSWYYLRYLDSGNGNEMFSVERAKKGTPVDLYIGGKEHAVLHLYYARFISHFLHSLKLLPEREPFKRLLVQGMVMGRSYRIKETGQYLPESDIEIVDLKKNQAVTKLDRKPVVISWEKMSKSKHNGVDPDQMFQEYSVDTVRLLIMADVAPTSTRNWNSTTFPGILNWQRRLWLTVREFIAHRQNPPLHPELKPDEFRAHDDYMFDARNYYLKGTTFNYCGSQQHSVALSKQQGLTNSIRRAPAAIYAKSAQFERALGTQIILLAPMAPHFASELWSGFVSAPARLTDDFDWDKGVLEQKWPTLDSQYNMDLIVEMNGEEVCVIKMPKIEMDRVTESEATAIALANNEVQLELNDKKVLKTRCTIQENYDIIVNITTNWVKRAKEEKPKKRRKR